jgi:hypothetical protein
VGRSNAEVVAGVGIVLFGATFTKGACPDARHNP